MRMSCVCFIIFLLYLMSCISYAYNILVASLIKFVQLSLEASRPTERRGLEGRQPLKEQQIYIYYRYLFLGQLTAAEADAVLAELDIAFVQAQCIVFVQETGAGLVRRQAIVLVQHHSIVLVPKQDIDSIQKQPYLTPVYKEHIVCVQYLKNAPLFRKGRTLKCSLSKTRRGPRSKTRHCSFTRARHRPCLKTSNCLGSRAGVIQ